MYFLTKKKSPTHSQKSRQNIDANFCFKILTDFLSCKAQHEPLKCESHQNSMNRGKIYIIYLKYSLGNYES